MTSPLQIAYLASSMRNRGGAERVNRAVLTQLNRDRFAPRAIFLKDAGELGRQLPQQGVPVVELGLSHRTQFLLGLARLFHHLRTNPVDILFTAEDKICMASAAFMRRLRAIPHYVVCLHGTRTWRGYIGMVHAFAMRSADRIVVLSERHKQFWQQHYPMPETRWCLIPNGIDLSKYLPRTPAEKAELRCQHGLHPERLTVGLVAFFKDSKNLPGFVAVARKVIDRGVSAQFVLVGDGPERPALEQAIRTHQMQAHFHLPGVTQEPEQWYAMFDIVLMTSLTEAFPLTLIEAAACAVPAVATNIAGIPDIVVDGETGFLAPPTALDQLAEYVVQLARDTELRQRMGAVARQRALSEFDVRVMVARYADMFKQVASRH